MPRDEPRLPIVHELPKGFRPEIAFESLKSIPGVLWLDSATTFPNLSHAGISLQPRLGQYSFLTASPLRRLSVHVGGPNPWPVLDQWCRDLPCCFRSDLPPFQGGIAGLIGYEAASWLENTPTSPIDDLPTPAVCLGLYDWTISFDHLSNKAWIIAQGLQATDRDRRYLSAKRRIDQVLSWLESPPSSEIESTTPLDVARVDGFPTPHQGVRSSFPAGGFGGRVTEIVKRIRSGDSFQVNLAQRLVTDAIDLPSDLYLRLRRANPAPFGGFYSGDGFSLLSSSPEGFLTVRDRVVQTRPIKGTVPRTGDITLDRKFAEQLSNSTKDRAENVMIVDLMRNDLSRVCKDSSVVIKELCRIEQYQYVQHLVSVIEGRLRDDVTISDLLKACFPGGSVTGAPKIEAMRTIAEMEPNPRGPYCGSLGYISCSGAADFNILIRCIVAVAGHWYFPVGGGITAQSIPESEEAETWTKALGMLRALGQPSGKVEQ